MSDAIVERAVEVGMASLDWLTDHCYCAEYRTMIGDDEPKCNDCKARDALRQTATKAAELVREECAVLCDERSQQHRAEAKQCTLVEREEHFTAIDKMVESMDIAAAIRAGSGE